MRKASKVLGSLGVRHALAGGLAVSAHGYPRNTKDVDFLVGDEAFERHAGDVVTFKSGIPLSVEGVAIDLLSTNEGAFLEEALPKAASAEVEVVPIGALVFMKLKAFRLRDRADLVELIKAGLPLHEVRAYLRAHAPETIAKLAACEADARAEQE
jgi:hypothetical protein